MINDDAKFFFCLSGFTGFLLFFLVSSIIQKDTIMALVYGAGGCLVFSIFGRYLLGFILKGIMQSSSTSIQQPATGSEAEPNSKNAKVVRNSRQNQKSTPKALARNKVSEGGKVWCLLLITTYSQQLDEYTSTRRTRVFFAKDEKGCWKIQAGNEGRKIS